MNSQAFGSESSPVSRATPALNLVALMDIFTILVFFLMFNSSDVEVLAQQHNITLPESIATAQPKSQTMISINGSVILLDGEEVASLNALSEDNASTIAGLAKALTIKAQAAPALTANEQRAGRAITVFGDRNTSYAVLKRILATCAASEYRAIALAVDQQLPANLAAKG